MAGRSRPGRHTATDRRASRDDYPAAAALAAQHREGVDLAECDRLLALLGQAEGDAVAFHRQSLSLSHAIVQAGRNDLFISISHLIHGMLAPLTLRFDAAQHGVAQRQGSATVDAIRRRQPAAAEAHMHAYLSALSAQAALRS